MNLRKTNSILNSEEFHRRLTFLRSKPRYVMVELTQGCNLSCEMCRPIYIPVSARRMHRLLFDQIAVQLFPTAEMVDLRGWGESLLLPEIAEYITTVANSGAAIRFVSNLSFERPELIPLLTRHHVYVAVSIDTADAALLRRLRGGARLELIKQNLAQLATAYICKWGTAERLSIGCTVQRPALESLHGMVELAAETGISHLRLFGVDVPSHSDLALDGHEQAVSRALTRVIETASRLGIAVSLGTRLVDRTPLPTPEPACLRYWSSATFTYDGMFGFCDHLIGPLAETQGIGSLLYQDFDTLWNSPHIQSLRAGVLQDTAECQWCRTNRYIDFEDFFEPELAHRRQWLQQPID